MANTRFSKNALYYSNINRKEERAMLQGPWHTNVRTFERFKAASKTISELAQPPAPVVNATESKEIVEAETLQAGPAIEPVAITVTQAVQIGEEDDVLSPDGSPGAEGIGGTPVMVSPAESPLIISPPLSPQAAEGVPGERYQGMWP